MCAEMAGDQWITPMKNVIETDGYKALVAFDPDTHQFRGEFVDLKGGADFHAVDVKWLQQESKISLKVFLDMYREDGVEPRKSYSGKLVVRLPAVRHERAAVSAASQGKSLNAWLADGVERAAQA